MGQRLNPRPRAGSPRLPNAVLGNEHGECHRHRGMVESRGRPESRRRTADELPTTCSRGSVTPQGASGFLSRVRIEFGWRHRIEARQTQSLDEQQGSRSRFELGDPRLRYAQRPCRRDLCHAGAFSTGGKAAADPSSRRGAFFAHHVSRSRHVSIVQPRLDRGLEASQGRLRRRPEHGDQGSPQLSGAGFWPTLSRADAARRLAELAWSRMRTGKLRRRPMHCL